MQLFQAIAQNARLLVDGNFKESAEIRQQRIINCLPSGSGFDCGAKIIKVDDQQITLETEFHHMDENGFYIVFVFAKNDIKDYIADVFNACMSSNFE